MKAISDRVAVLYQGRLCEIGPVNAVYEAPFHPYTDVLLGAVLEPDPDIAPILSADDVVELIVARLRFFFFRIIVVGVNDVVLDDDISWCDCC